MPLIRCEKRNCKYNQSYECSADALEISAKYVLYEKEQPICKTYEFKEDEE